MAQSLRPSNAVIIEQLKRGIAKFELVCSTVPTVSTPNFSAQSSEGFSNSHLCFARIGPPLAGGASAVKKVEHYTVQRVAADGRCMFRALVKGMAKNKCIPLHPREERDGADELRMAIKEVICENDAERCQYEEAVVAITVDESLKRYCQRIQQSDFWGGEPELLVLSKLCSQPIIVYIPEHEHSKSERGSGFIPIAEYGTEYGKDSRKGNARKAVRLLYSGGNHYDLLI